MENESFFFILCSIWYWYFKQYENRRNLFNTIMKSFYETIRFLDYCNKVMYPEQFINELYEKDEKDDVDVKHEIPIILQKYEDKYKPELRNLVTQCSDDEFVFIYDNNDEKIKSDKIIEYEEQIINEYKDKLYEIRFKLSEYEKSSNDYCIYESDHDIKHFKFLGNETLNADELLKLKLELLNEEIELNKLIETVEGKKQISEEAIELAVEFMDELYKTRLEYKFKNSYVIEHTPNGNVLMMYDKSNEIFKYYSDNTIPYRYLEVVGRKYAKQLNCKHIFIDMEEEIQTAKDKFDNKKREKEEKEKEEKEKEEISINKSEPLKKNIFAKFKSYNKEGGTGRVNSSAPPKNSMTTNKTAKNDTELTFLKERTNRYRYEGKFANFNFIQKPDRKVFDKKLAMSFSDFKKIILNK